MCIIFGFKLQLILKATSGIDYADFFQFMVTIAIRRCEFLDGFEKSSKKCKIVCESKNLHDKTIQEFPSNSDLERQKTCNNESREISWENCDKSGTVTHVFSECLKDTSKLSAESNSSTTSNDLLIDNKYSDKCSSVNKTSKYSPDCHSILESSVDDKLHVVNSHLKNISLNPSIHTKRCNELKQHMSDIKLGIVYPICDVRIDNFCDETVQHRDWQKNHAIFDLKTVRKIIINMSECKDFVALIGDLKLMISPSEIVCKMDRILSTIY